MAYRFLGDGEAENTAVTFGELHRRALAVATRLRWSNACGERAILLYPQGIEFIVAFLGCLYAGVVAVPVSVPSRKRGSEVLRKVALDARASWLLSTGDLLEQLSRDLPTGLSTGALSYLDTEACGQADVSGALPAIQADDIALLQYTSGSTGSPRGVAVTHGNLIHNQRQIQDSFGYEEGACTVSWLPMFHDMGLGTVLGTLWAGMPCVLLSPRGFLQEPRRWLQAISDYRGTISGGPDFAYDMCVRRIEPKERRGLDLSSWLIAFNGSEPVRASTLDRFSEAFAAHGFRRTSFHPLYGLAEATLLVSSGARNEAPEVKRFSTEALTRGLGSEETGATGGLSLVSCGRPSLGMRIVVVNPETREECDPGHVGEIWLQGPSIAAGYWQKPAETEQTFHAVTASGDGPFLRTGDLGFLNAGQLFVTGRHKDVIIIRGRNHYPQDIEDAVSTSHPALVPLACAAFSVEVDQREELVVVQEVARSALRTLDSGAVIQAMRGAVSEHHALHTHAVVLLKPATLPRTTSGKVQRKACRAAFLEKALPAVAAWSSPVSRPPDSTRSVGVDPGSSSGRADRLIEWLRQNAADLIHAHASTEPQRSPAVLLQALAKQGLLGMQVDAAHGGLGLGSADTLRVLEQLAAIDFPLALFIGRNNALGIQPVARHARPETKALLLPGLAQGQELAAFAFEEPTGRSAPSGLAAHAESQSEERWRLFGTKYLDGAEGASVVNVFVHHDEPPGISAFVVSQGATGRQVRGDLALNLLGFARGTVVFDGVEVGREGLLGSFGSGIEIAREALMHARLASAATCIGGMKRCAQLVGRDGPYHGSLNGNLTPNPVLLSRLGSVTASITALECLVRRIARALDGGYAVPAEAFAACKILASELLVRCVNDLMRLNVDGRPTETIRLSRLYRDAGLLRDLDGPPEALAELTGAVVMEDDSSLRRLVEDVLHAPTAPTHIQAALAAVRQRMGTLTGALARRSQRWGHTRAGELCAWVVLLAAVEGSTRASPTRDVERAFAWVHAQFQHALSAVRWGTPSETATLDTSDVAAAFAAYSHTIGDLEQSASADEAPRPHEPPSSDLRAWTISWLARRLQIPAARVETGRSFSDHGLDSVAAVEFTKALSDKLGRSLDDTLLWHFASLDALVESLSSTTSSVTESALTVRPDAGFECDAILPEDVRPAFSALPAAEPATLLLTGATGFLGAFLLRDLLEHTRARVYCLVRAENASVAAWRVTENLRSYGLPHELPAARVGFVVGDLRMPRLGLANAVYERLVEELDAIYNNGAALSFVGSYAGLKASHVDGTRELLRLSTLGRPKALHHVSSTVVYDSFAYRGRPVPESLRPSESRGHHLGYAECKWVSEALVWEAAERGLSVTVHRPAFISGSSANGAWNTADFLCRTIKTILSLGCIPELDLELDFSPVDYVSRAIVHLSSRTASRGRAFHLQNPSRLPLAQLGELLRELGYSVRSVPYQEWVSRIAKQTDGALRPLLPFLTQRCAPHGLTQVELWQRGHRPELTCEETLDALRGTDFTCPAIDRSLIERYLEFLSAQGFIPRAQG